MAYVSGEAAREQFRARLFALDLLDREAAAALGVNSRTLYKWLSGERRIPVSAVTILDMLLREKDRAAPHNRQIAALHNRGASRGGGEEGKGGL